MNIIIIHRICRLLDFLKIRFQKCLIKSLFLDQVFLEHTGI